MNSNFAKAVAFLLALILIAAVAYTAAAAGARAGGGAEPIVNGIAYHLEA